MMRYRQPVSDNPESAAKIDYRPVQTQWVM